MTNTNIHMSAIEQIQKLEGISHSGNFQISTPANNDGMEVAENNVVNLGLNVTSQTNAIVEGKFGALIGKEMSQNEIVSILEQIGGLLDTNISTETTEQIVRNLEAFRKVVISKNPETLRSVEDKIVEIVSSYSYNTYYKIAEAA